MDKIYVIAGNYSQFKYYFSNNYYYEYVGDCIQLLGTHNVKVALVGSYFSRKDWEQLKNLLNATQAEIILNEYEPEIVED